MFRVLSFAFWISARGEMADRPRIGSEAEPCEGREGGGLDERDMAEPFAFRGVRQVHLHRRQPHRLERIQDGDGRVRVRGGVHHKRIERPARGLYAVHYRAFVVGLEHFHIHACIARARLDEPHEVCIRAVPVERRFAQPQQIEVRPVYDKNLHVLPSGANTSFRIRPSARA